MGFAPPTKGWEFSKTESSRRKIAFDLVSWFSIADQVYPESMSTQSRDHTNNYESILQFLDNTLPELLVYRFRNHFVKSEKDIFLFYNGRANIENNIKEVKYDYSLGKIVTDSFEANDVITQITMMAYILMTHFKNECLPEKYKKCFLSTIRNQVFNMIGKLFTDSNQVYSRIKNVFCDASFYAYIFDQVQKLRSWVVDPPILEIAAA